MAKFVYSMQNILDMKEKLERQEKNDYSRANVRLLEAQDELERLKDRQREQEEKLRQNLKESMQVLQIKEAENGVEVIKMYVKQQMLCVKQRERELEEARTRLALAMRERKTFEKLREKAFQQFMEEENKIVEREDGSWLVDGLLDVDEFKEFFHIDEELPGEEKDLYKTMGGLLNVLFGRIPKELDKAKWNGYTFEVVDMDNTRIDKILVTYEEPIVVQETEEKE